MTHLMLNSGLKPLASFRLKGALINATQRDFLNLELRKAGREAHFPAFQIDLQLG